MGTQQQQVLKVSQSSTLYIYDTKITLIDDNLDADHHSIPMQACEAYETVKIQKSIQKT